MTGIGLVSGRKLPVVLLLAAGGLLVTPPVTFASADVTAAPGATTSTYLTLTGDTATDVAAVHQLGCAAGRQGRPGVRALMYGTQEAAGLRHPGTTAGSDSPRIPLDLVERTAGEWIVGFVSCRTSQATAVLALAVNNKQDGGMAGAVAGGQWAGVVDRVAAAATDGSVTVAGSSDLEPPWSTKGWARDWLAAYTGATRRTLYSTGSADGCPGWGQPGLTCANGWTLGDVYHVASGPTVEMLPQVYTPSGTMARQWSRISAWGVQHGEARIRFAGVLSQQQACGQRGGCAGRTDNTPATAWTQLFNELNAHSETATSTLGPPSDMRWQNG